MKKQNKRKRTPIPLLAYHMRLFNRPMERKGDLARTRAWIAERFYQASFKINERL